MKIILITNSTDASIGMRLAGVETVLVRTEQKARDALEKAVNSGDAGLILITDGIEKFCNEEVASIKKKGRPLLICVPDSDKGFESSGAIGDYVRNAIGINV